MSEPSKPVSFTLGEHDVSFIANMVENGRFGNKTEVVRAGLRMLEDHEYSSKLLRLRALVAEGDADMAAGRTTKYTNARELLEDITKS